MAVPNMIEKTLRYPGHAERIRALRASGFFAVEPVDVAGGRVRPLDVTSAVLFKQWHLADEDDEFTLMRLHVEGVENDRPRSVVYSLFDRRDRRTGFSSMARTTGFPATAVARLVLAGRFSRKGVCPPETVGVEEASFRFVLDELRARHVSYSVEG
jgi:saccharopine dehydrogenase-like NADP-dependent oxidoreductase